MTYIKAAVVTVESEKLNLVKLHNFNWLFSFKQLCIWNYVDLSQGKMSSSVPFLFDALSTNNSNTHLSKSVRKRAHVNHLYISVNWNQSVSFSWMYLNFVSDLVLQNIQHCYERNSSNRGVRRARWPLWYLKLHKEMIA